MAAIKKLKPGMYIFHKNGKKMERIDVYEVDIDRGLVFATWPGHPPTWYQKSMWSKWQIPASKK